MNIQCVKRNQIRNVNKNNLNKKIFLFFFLQRVNMSLAITPTFRHNKCDPT